MADIQAMAAKIIKTFSIRGLTVATAESLTGGLIGATLTSVPGSSSIYLGGLIVYSRVSKTRLAKVPKSVLDQHTVVSEQTVVDMAIGAQELLDADWVVAVTGVAGPDPQEGHDPGEVWVAVLGPRVGMGPYPVQARRFAFAGDRNQIREQTVAAALEMLQGVLSPV